MPSNFKIIMFDDFYIARYCLLKKFEKNFLFMDKNNEEHTYI